MKTPTIRNCALALASLLFAFTTHAAPADSKQLPEVLQDWKSWALWDENPAPPDFRDGEVKFSVWPSQMQLDVRADGATFSVAMRVFRAARVELPGNADFWPQEVFLNDQAVPVTPRDGKPSIYLEPGIWSIRGVFLWATMPQQLTIPANIGLLTLRVNGSEMPFPAWDADGALWLRRDRVSDEPDKDFLSTQVYRVIDDGIPMWLRTEIELTVSGKNREEIIGGVLPAGWKLSSVNAPIPVFVNPSGEMRAQVRPGRWVIEIDAFRLDSPTEVAYPAGIEPAASEELVAFRAQPDLRLVDVTGIPAVDVSQTTFPEKWRSLPVYRWETATPFGLAERQRGMGLQQPAGLAISRQLWLDEDGKGITFQDQISGVRQEIWRLDAAAGQMPGSIQANGAGQLITRNPTTGAPGVEIRNRDLQVTATGRMDDVSDFSATGWQTNADNLSATLMLPPGWRLFMMFGPDEVDGEWLSSWSLLDLFLLLIFSVAVFKLWGIPAGVFAFIAFAAAYHEPNAPKFLWLALLMPIALLRVVPAGVGRHFILAWKWITVVVLAFALIPFLSQQVQQMIYPQLERVDGPRFLPTPANAPHAADSFVLEEEPAALPMLAQQTDANEYSKSWVSGKTAGSGVRKRSEDGKSNLLYAAGARIQTGPGLPEWGWRPITMRWNGPVTADQVVDPILIPVGVERILTGCRILMLLALAALLLNAWRIRARIGRPGATAAAVVFAAAWMAAMPNARAQFPAPALIEQLRERLTTTTDAFPNAADISSATLQVEGNRLTVISRIHVSEDCAVPLPGRLPDWSPVSVLIDGVPAEAVMRRDGFLWVALQAGVHEVTMGGILPETADWEWTFLLKPRRIAVDAPDWNVTGINADGVPESQVFLSRKQKADVGETGYDRQVLDTVAIVERHFEIGLVWQLRTTVRRLSPRGTAIELRVPLVPGERILSSNLVVDGNLAEVRIGGSEDEVSWSSEVPVTEALSLSVSPDATWVERWTLVASPVWNLTFSGIAPVFEAGNPQLVPVWSPWPGESLTWNITRPEPEPGATLTIDRVQHTVSVGSRQRTSELNLGLRSSLGEEFSIQLPELAEITSLTHDGQSIPVRIDQGRLVMPLKPGAQNVNVNWRMNADAGFDVRVDTVQLSVESANVRTTMQVGDDRWVLWTHGPLRGPAVRFWMVLAVALAAGFLLGSIHRSPLKRHEWMLLSLGLTQVPLPVAMLVTVWFFYFVWRGSSSFQVLPAFVHNVIQVIAVLATGAFLLAFIWIVGAGLLGSPEMFILGNGSRQGVLQWYQDRCGVILSQPGYFSISIWWYRLLMLLWALWLASSLLRWLWWAWGKFTIDGVFRAGPQKSQPPLP